MTFEQQNEISEAVETNVLEARNFKQKLEAVVRENEVLAKAMRAGANAADKAAESARIALREIE